MAQPAGLHLSLFDHELLPDELDFIDGLKMDVVIFRYNMNRSRSAIDGLFVLGTFIGIYERAGAYASVELLKREPTTEETTHENFQKSIRPSIEKRADFEFASWGKDIMNWVRIRDSTKEKVDFMFASFGDPESQIGHHLSTTAQKLFQDMIIGTWTAIEVILGKLYQLSREGRPDFLPTEQALWWRTMDILKTRGVLKISKKPDEFKLPTLSSLPGLRMSYSMAFIEDADEIDKYICDEGLDTLNLLRNQFIHEAGRINDSFKRDTKKLPLLNGYNKRDDPIILTATNTRQIIESALKPCVSLLYCVNSWFKKHRPHLTELPL